MFPRVKKPKYNIKRRAPNIPLHIPVIMNPIIYVKYCIFLVIIYSVKYNKPAHNGLRSPTEGLEHSLNKKYKKLIIPTITR